jgi:hypothetical protein
VSEEQNVEVEVEVEVVDEQQAQEGQAAAGGEKKANTGATVGKAINTIVGSLEAALTGRGNAVMVRVNDEALSKLDMLVEAGICKSRSESAAFLLQRGIDSSGALFDRIQSVTSQITKMREELLSSVSEAE